MAAATYTVERSTTAHATPEALFAQVVDFRRWPAWSPWEDLDPAMRRTYSGSAQGVGSVYEWSGNRKAGQGRMQITDTDEPTRVVVDLRFLKPFRSRSVTTFSFVPEGVPEAGLTRVTWAMVGPRTPALRLMGLVTSMDKLVGGDFDKGLARPARVAEADGH